MRATSIEEVWIAGEGGRLFAKRWRPAAGKELAPFVLLHDSLGCVALWRDFPKCLAVATGREVIAYDRLGFGQSDAHPGTLEVSFVQDEASTSFRAVHGALRLDRFIAFGHSVGGGMAVACAASYPESCVGLVTESAQAFVEDRTVQGIVAARESFRAPGQLERLQRYHGDKAAWVLHAWIDTWLAPGFAGWNLDESLRGVRCPVLAVHGELDEFGSSEHPQRIASLTVDHSQMHVLAACGRVPHREQPEMVLELMRHWLDVSNPDVAPRSECKRHPARCE